MIPPNWGQEQRYEYPELVFADIRLSPPRKGGKGGRSQPVSASDPFPSLPPSGRLGFPQYAAEASLEYGRVFQPVPPPPPHVSMTHLSGEFGNNQVVSIPIPHQNPSVWSSPVRGPTAPNSVWQPPSTEHIGEEVGSSPGSGSGNYLRPDDSPRTFHDHMKNFTGIGAEAYRSSFGLPEDRGISWEFQCMRERVLATTSRDPNSIARVPEIVQHKYHSLLVLDASPTMSPVLGYRTWAYKALSTTDPYVYCLRRVDGFRLSNFDLVQDAVERWSELKHPNIVSVRQAFATSEFQDAEGTGEGGSLVYVYDYIDLAQTLEGWQQVNDFKSVHETVLWDVIVQTCLALRLIHSQGLVARCMHPSKLLVSSRFRVHLNCLGLMDAIQHQSLATLPLEALNQKHDLTMFAKLVLSLGLGRPWAHVGDVSSLVLEAEKLPYSLARVIQELVSPHGSAESVIALCGSFVAFKAEQLESTQDVLVSELRKFIDISRLHKILVKICAVSDRVNLLDDWRWANTGDRYIVQLFRDYIFYQNDELGRPFLDIGHITDCLAKVDVGSFEPLMLMNRDGSSVLVTNYSDVRRCIESSFKEIADASLPRPLHLNRI